MCSKTSSISVTIRRISRVVFLLFLFSFLGLTAGNCLAQSLDNLPQPADFSNLTWSEAFEKMHEKFSREYAFTDWKEVDWAVLYAKFKPQVDQAQIKNDFSAYYLTLKEYVHEIPDGHVRMTGIRAIDNQYIGGGFGFSAAKLSNGKVIACWVDENSAAYSQGMRPGAELIEWNGRSIQDVLPHVSTIFGPNSATMEDLDNQKVRYLTRAPIHTQISLTFLNAGQVSRATVAAYDDKGKSLTKTYPASVVSDGLRDLILEVDNPQNPPMSMVEKKILDENIGYIKLWGELDIDLKNTGKAPSTLELFRTALSELNHAKVNGLIIDIRNNVGGLDSMAADMLASFYQEPILYEYLYWTNTATGVGEIYPVDEKNNNTSDPGLYIRPAIPFFAGPVVALINSKCVSSGEGLAMGVKNLPKGETVGFYGTNGSFGMAGGEAKMPRGIAIHWPYGQSLNKHKQVQLDSRDGIGGISPSIRIPMTKENALREAIGDDVELESAIEIIRNLANSSRMLN